MGKPRTEPILGTPQDTIRLLRSNIAVLRAELAEVKKELAETQRDRNYWRDKAKGNG